MANTIWQWFQENEATAGGVTDKIASYMARQGYVAATNEMLYNWLKDLGYSITLNEMLAKFEEENPSMIDGFIKSEANVLSTVSSDYTFSRTGNQTGINSSNQIYVATTGIPAYISGQGILLEGARTNLLTYSRNMTNAAWIKTDITAARTQTGADGAANSAVTITTSSAFHSIRQMVTVTENTQYTFSFYVKRGTMTDLKYSVYDFSNLANVVAATSYYSQTSSTEWKRISVTFTTPAGCTSIGIYPLRDSGVTGTVIFDYAQLEVGPFASSPIETVAAAVTRNATSLSRNWTLPANNFSGQIKFRPQFARGQLVNQILVGFSDGTSNNRYQINLSGTGYIGTGKYVGGVSVFSSAATTLEFTNNQLINIRFKQDSSGMSFWVNNVSVIKTTTGIAPNDYSTPLTQLWLNQTFSGATPCFTVFESVKIWHEARSDEFLAALT